MDQVSQANSRQKCKYKSKKVGLVYTRPLAREINKGLTEVFCYSTSNMVTHSNCAMEKCLISTPDCHILYRSRPFSSVC